LYLSEIIALQKLGQSKSFYEYFMDSFSSIESDPFGYMNKFLNNYWGYNELLMPSIYFNYNFSSYLESINIILTFLKLKTEILRNQIPKSVIPEFIQNYPDCINIAGDYKFLWDKENYEIYTEPENDHLSFTRINIIPHNVLVEANKKYELNK
jgi:hypothetical protein